MSNEVFENLLILTSQTMPRFFPVESVLAVGEITSTLQTKANMRGTERFKFFVNTPIGKKTIQSERAANHLFRAERQPETAEKNRKASHEV